MKKNVTAYIGLNYGDADWSKDEAVGVISKAMAAHGIDGMTITEATGYWQGESETSLRIDLLKVSVKAAKKALQDVCTALAQYAVAYTVNGRGYHEVTADAQALRDAMENSEARAA